jgi:hypothetical protein
MEIHPRSIARTTARVRSEVDSFAEMLRRWFRTVRSLIPSVRPIWRLLPPRATSTRISSWRSVNGRVGKSSFVMATWCWALVGHESMWPQDRLPGRSAWRSPAYCALAARARGYIHQSPVCGHLVENSAGNDASYPRDVPTRWRRAMTIAPAPMAAPNMPSARSLPVTSTDG